MRLLKRSKLPISLLLVSLLTACAEGEVPDAPESGESAEVEAGAISGQAERASSDVFEYGAQGGPAEMRALVDQCGRNGFFYDRVASSCDETRPIPFAANSYDLVMEHTKPTENQRTKIDNLLVDLEGYLFDQVTSLEAQDDQPARYEIHLVKFEDDGRILVSKMTLERDL